MVGNDVVCTRRRNRRGVIYLVWRHPGWRAHTSFENILELTETLSKVVVGSGRSRGLRHQAARIGNLYRCPNFRTVASERHLNARPRSRRPETKHAIVERT